MRKVFAIILSAALLLGCFAASTSVGASASAAEPAVSRVVTTFYGPGAQAFHWFTDDKAESAVTIGGERYTGTSKQYKGAWAHSVVAEGLKPGKSYSYQIGDYKGSFQTDPGPGKPMSFIVGGDPQATNRDGFTLSGNIFKVAFREYPKADFYAILGDLTQNSNNAQWDMFFEEFADINAKAPLVPVSGNHDGSFHWNWFRNIFTLKEQPNYTNLTGVYYSFDYGDAHIAVLNTNDWFHIGRAQRNWLINDMNTSNAKWKIIMTHKPVYFHYEIAPDVMALRRTLGPVCDALGIDLALSGHKHSYTRSAPLKGQGIKDYERCEEPLFTDLDGTIYAMPGAAGGRGGDSPSFANIEIKGDTLVYRAHIYDRATDSARLRDEFTIAKTKPAAPAEPFDPLPTGPLRTLPGQLLEFASRLAVLVVVDYTFRGLFIELIKDLF